MSDSLVPTGPSSSHASLVELPDEAVAESVQLVRDAQAGSRDALSLLLARYQDRVHRIARVRLGRRARSYLDSADVVQETLLTAAQHLHTLEVRDHASVIAWLSRLLENQILNAVAYTRAQKRDPDRAVALEALRPADASGPGLDPVDGASSPASVAARHELAELLDAAVAELEPDQREVVLLRDYCQADWPTIAAALDRSIGAVQQLHLRARTKLAPVLKRRIGS